MPNQMELRLIESEADRSLAENVIHSAFSAVVEDPSTNEFAAVDFASGAFFVLDIQGSVSGTVAVRPVPNREGLFELRSLALVTDWQHGGLGRFMVDKASGYVKDNGGRNLIVVLDDSLIDAIGFFSHLGFKDTREDPDSHAGRFIMVKGLY